MKRIIIGTAGHIDHGKTTMIQALTGVDTDRLKEEKKRGISIELGFAGFDIEGIGKVGIVDVPGHEKFIKHMLAGATGIDVVLFVIAADEGVMPQTVEHLDILELLNLKKGIIILTKVDLIEDEEWLELVKGEVREKVRGTFLENSPIIPFSGVTKQGREELVKMLQKIADETESKSSFGKVRLPIDRVFTIKGFGTVVTGTLWSGEIKIGDMLEIEPGEKQVRVRTLQVHDKSVEVAQAGQRTAVGIHGVTREEVERGDTLLTPKSLSETFMLDARLNLLKHSERTIGNRARVHFHLGTQEVLARIVLLEKKVLEPGDSAFVQFRLEAPVVADFKDRFVIRSYSPVHTIGGGIVLDPHPKKHSRFKSDVIEHLRTLEKGKPDEIVEEVIAKTEFRGIKIDELKKKVEISLEKLEEVLGKLEKENRILSLENFLIHRIFYEKIVEQVQNYLTEFHEKHPYLSGESKENLKAKLASRIPPPLMENILKALANQQIIEFIEHKVKLREHKIQLTEAQNAIKLKIIRIFEESDFMPPSREEILEKFSSKKDAEIALTSMLELGELIKVSSNLMYLKTTLEKAEKNIVEYLKEHKEMTMSEAKEQLKGATRKYAVPLMEYLDKKSVTMRWGDKRFLNEDME